MSDYKLQVGDLVSFKDLEGLNQFGLVTQLLKLENKCLIYWFDKSKAVRHKRKMTSLTRFKVISYAE